MTIDQKLLAQMTDSPTKISIEKLIGEENFIRLSEELGGRQLYIPATPTPGCPLAVVVGLDAATKMGQVWGGMEYEIPLMAGRKARIIKMYQAGMPIVRIAPHLRISIRTVRRIVNSMKDDDQLPLDL